MTWQNSSSAFQSNLVWFLKSCWCSGLLLDSEGAVWVFLVATKYVPQVNNRIIAPEFICWHQSAFGFCAINHILRKIARNCFNIAISDVLFENFLLYYTSNTIAISSRLWFLGRAHISTSKVEWSKFKLK